MTVVEVITGTSLATGCEMVGSGRSTSDSDRGEPQLAVANAPIVNAASAATLLGVLSFTEPKLSPGQNDLCAQSPAKTGLALLADAVIRSVQWSGTRLAARWSRTRLGWAHTLASRHHLVGNRPTHPRDNWIREVLLFEHRADTHTVPQASTNPHMPMSF